MTMQVCAITNQKGGCGKTTTALSLAYAFANRGKSTLLIDLDPQAHATMACAIQSVEVAKSSFALFKDPSASISNLALNLGINIDMIPSHIVLSTIEHQLKDHDNGLMILFKTLMRENLTYDYVIIDCPPNLGFLTFNAIRAADQIIIPVEPSTFALMGVSKLISMIELIKLKLHHSPTVKGLVTMYDPLAAFSQKMLFKIRNMFKNNIFKTIITYDMAFKESQEKFVSVFTHNKDAKGARDYMNLADELSLSSHEAIPEKVYDDLQKILYNNVFAKEKTFEYEDPNAKNVYVVGDFNDWKINEDSKLEKADHGKWQKRFLLAPGRYKYKYVVDGFYFEDPNNPIKEPNPYGNNDSIFNID